MTVPDPARPRRVKVRGDLFHGRVPDNTVYIGRRAPGLAPSPYANPFRPGDNLVDRSILLAVADGLLPPHQTVADKAHAAALFAHWIRQPEQSRLREAARRDLAGRDLACWCAENHRG